MPFIEKGVNGKVRDIARECRNNAFLDRQVINVADKLVGAIIEASHEGSLEAELNIRSEELPESKFRTVVEFLKDNNLVVTHRADGYSQSTNFYVKAYKPEE